MCVCVRASVKEFPIAFSCVQRRAASRVAAKRFIGSRWGCPPSWCVASPCFCGREKCGLIAAQRRFALLVARNLIACFSVERTPPFGEVAASCRRQATPIGIGCDVCVCAACCRARVEKEVVVVTSILLSVVGAFGRGLLALCFVAFFFCVIGLVARRACSVCVCVRVLGRGLLGFVVCGVGVPRSSCFSSRCTEVLEHACPVPWCRSGAFVSHGPLCCPSTERERRVSGVSELKWNA